MAVGTVRVIEPGLLTTIEDARGRPGLGRFGVAPGGAMDAPAARLANRLVGNEGDEPVLEITLHGPRLEWADGAHVGLAGADLGAVAGGLELPPGHSYVLRPGSLLRFRGARAGARAYLAVEGGFEIPMVLGSTSTDRRSGFGGLDGRALREGDVLRFGPARSSGPELRTAVVEPTDPDRRLRLIPTPAGFGWFAPGAVRTFCATRWTVAPDSDRSGIRLTGARLDTLTTGFPSLGVPVGSVQVPPGGQPIVTMVDGPVTGGYPVLGVVARLDLPRLAQAVPGSTLRFARVSVADVRRASLAEEGLARVDLDAGDFAAGWAG